jgi:hypothetical protein
MDRTVAPYASCGVIHRAGCYVTVNMSDRGTIATFVALTLLSAGLVAMAFFLP